MSDSHYAVDATNRLSIAHLLLWMATTSAVLAFLQAWDVPYGPLDSSESDTEFKFASFHQTKRIMNRMIAPAYGVALAAGVLTTWRAVMQWPGFPTHPGHWMLLVVCMWAATIATTVSVADLLRVSFSLEGTIFAALMLANATVAGIGAFRATRQGTELWVFPLLALTFVAGTMAVCGIVVACSDPPSAPPMLPLFVLGFGAPWLRLPCSPPLASICGEDDRAMFFIGLA